ncbi:MAG: hypothetical protein AAF039_15285 [Bacteroidota bacterium]
MSKDIKTINRFNEEIILPTMLMFSLFSIVCAIYLLNELVVDKIKFKDYYSYGHSLEAYTSMVSYLLVGFLAIVSIQLYAIKLKRATSKSIAALHVHSFYHRIYIQHNRASD